MTRHYPGRVSPFGDLRIKAYLRLPEAFRSLSRPSSAISALASTLRSSSLDLACLLLLPKTSAFAVDGRSKPLCLSRPRLRSIAAALQPRRVTFLCLSSCLPCAVFKVRARLPQPFGLSQLRGCGTVVSSPLVGLAASLGRAPPPPPVCFASELLKVLHFFRSFKTIQCFNQDSSQFVALSGSTEFSVALWYLYHFFLLQLPLSFLLKLDLGFGSLFTNHFSLERR